MPTLAEIRQQYPQYSDMPDADLAGALYSKFYSDIPRTEFDSQIGLVAASPQPVVDEVNSEPADHGLSERQKMSTLELAINPITSYPETYLRMNKDARAQVSRGVEQLSSPKDGWDIAKGAGNAVFGSLGYVGSPITAAYRSVVGQPIEDVTGIPREYTEFAAQLATPGLGLVGAGKSTPSVVTATQKAAPTIQELKAAASKGYESDEVAGLTIKAPALTSFAERTGIVLNEAGLDANVAPKTFGVLASLTKAPEGAVVTGKNLNSLRKVFGNAAKSADPTERLAASRVIESLDELVPSLARGDIISGDAAAASKTLDTARANYSAAKHAETIDNKTIQAELRAAAANSGQNVANTVRQRMADILIKPKEQHGFTASELAQMNAIVRGTRSENALRTAGNVLGGGGGMGAVVSAGVGGFATGGWGAIAPGVGYVMKAAGNKMTLKQAERLSDAVRSRAPLAESMQKFEVKAAEYKSNPKALAGLALAARNLANELRASGVNVSLSDLMNGLQSPGTGRAEDQ